MNSKTYYQVGADLFEYNPRTRLFYQRNVLKSMSPVEAAEFEKWERRQIKKAKFSELMNQFFAKAEHKWYYEQVLYRKMQNFSKEGVSEGISINQMPRYKTDEDEDVKRGFLVYHWGKVYIAGSYDIFDSALHLFVPKTLEIVRWVRIQHLSPIMNEFSKSVV